MLSIPSTHSFRQARSLKPRNKLDGSISLARSADVHHLSEVSHEAPFLKHRACTLERSRAACFSWPLRAKPSLQTVAKKDSGAPLLADLAKWTGAESWAGSNGLNLSEAAFQRSTGVLAPMEFLRA